MPEMQRRPTQRSAFVLVGAIVLAACGSATTQSSDAPSTSTDSTARQQTQATRDDDPFPVDQVESSPRDVTSSGIAAFRNGSTDGLPDPLVDLQELRSGGPPPDGIPPVDEPKFLRTGDVDFLADNEPVLALEIDGDARAYPVQILTWHEIVNDTVGGVPVSVTYCPLCNSALAYDRRLADRILDFGTSGLLFNSALVMYDRQSETLWSHFTGEGVIGELTGERLETFPMSTVSWAAWREANPDGLVLSTDTGHNRDYGRNPYPGYDDVDSFPFLFSGEVDGRYAAKTRFVGVELDGAAVGIPLDDLREAEVVATAAGPQDLVVWWAAGTASALDTSAVSAGTDVGSTGVFIPEVDDRTLTFTSNGDGTFTDTETGSTWNILGQATGGELDGATLDGVSHVDTFWFAWSTFRPDTVVATG